MNPPSLILSADYNLNDSGKISFDIMTFQAGPNLAQEAMCAKWWNERTGDIFDKTIAPRKERNVTVSWHDF